jgi:hypothetical protein
VSYLPCYVADIEQQVANIQAKKKNLTVAEHERVGLGAEGHFDTADADDEYVSSTSNDKKYRIYPLYYYTIILSEREKSGYSVAKKNFFPYLL